MIVTLDKEACRGFPKPPRKIVFLDWHMENPSKVQGSKGEKEKAFNDAYDLLSSRISELIEALKSTGKEK